MRQQHEQSAQQDGWSPIADSKKGLVLLHWAARALAVSVEPLLHSRLGVNAIGIPGALAVLVMALWPLIWRGHDPRPMWGFLAVYLLACVVARVRATWREWRPRRGQPIEHSRYSGFPVLFGLLQRCTEVKFKLLVEPLLVATVGVIVQRYSSMLGWYLLWAGAGLLVSVALTAAAERAQARAMHDAVIAQRHVVSTFREFDSNGVSK